MVSLLVSVVSMSGIVTRLLGLSDRTARHCLVETEKDRLMILIPLAVLWAGYTGVWYGWSLLQGEGMGLADLVFPARGGKADSTIKGWGQGGASAASQPPYIPGPGVQPGSPSFPANPNGGLPSKPPVGGTPPAYYN